MAVIVVLSVTFGSIGGDFSQKVLSRLDIIMELLGSFAKMVSAITPVIGAVYGVWTAMREGGANERAKYEGEEAIQSYKNARFAKFGKRARLDEAPNAVAAGDEEAPAAVAAGDEETLGGDDLLLLNASDAAWGNLERSLKELMEKGTFSYCFWSTVHRRAGLSVKISIVEGYTSQYIAMVKEAPAVRAAVQAAVQAAEEELVEQKKRAHAAKKAHDAKRAHAAKKAHATKMAHAAKKTHATKMALNALQSRWGVVGLQQQLGGEVHSEEELEQDDDVLETQQALTKAEEEVQKAEQEVKKAKDAAVLDMEATIKTLRKLQSEIEELRHIQWYTKNRRNKEKLDNKRAELATTLQKMPPDQRLDWVLRRA